MVGGDEIFRQASKPDLNSIPPTMRYQPQTFICDRLISQAARSDDLSVGIYSDLNNLASRPLFQPLNQRDIRWPPHHRSPLPALLNALLNHPINQLRLISIPCLTSESVKKRVAEIDYTN